MMQLWGGREWHKQGFIVLGRMGLCLNFWKSGTCNIGCMLREASCDSRVRVVQYKGVNKGVLTLL